MSEPKLEEYSNKVYKGTLPKLKKKLEKEDSWSWPSAVIGSATSKIVRTPVTKSQEKTVIDKCKRKCVVCGKKYKDADDFHFHHVNGDRTMTATKNLVLVCLKCHKKIHTRANAKLKDYKVIAKRKK